MLKCQDIHKSYAGLEVLRGVDLEVSEREIVSVVGASGAGKTTLLQIAGTLLSADRGEVVLDGISVGRLSTKELAVLRNTKIGFVFQFHHLLPEFTALENVMIPALIAGANRTDAAQRATQLIEMVGLSDRSSHKPSAMSGGEQQRVAVARALINSPKVIFADEPSGNLDSVNRDELHSLFMRVREQTNAAFVIVTHDNDLASRSDRVITMKDGLICK